MDAAEIAPSIRKSFGVASLAIGLACAIALLYFGRLFFVTLILAIIIAFLLEPPVALLVRVRLPRSLASFIVCAVALLGIYLAGLGIYMNSSDLIDQLPNYGKRISELIDDATGMLDRAEQSIYALLLPKRMREEEQQRQAQAAAQAEAARQRKRKTAEPPPAVPPPVQEVRIRPEPTPLAAYIYTHLSSVYEVLLMASFVPFLVYFMLSWRDHIHRSFLQLFDDGNREVARKTLDDIASMVRAFVVGNFALGVLLSLATGLVCVVFRLPYPLLVGPLSGFLSLFPYIGLPLAMLPPLAAALTVYNKMAAYLVIGTVVAVLHLLALNLLYPKIVGSRVHLNPLVVTVALMLWGSLWGAIGLALAIPLTAGIKAVCDSVERLQPYGRLLGD